MKVLKKILKSLREPQRILLKLDRCNIIRLKDETFLKYRYKIEMNQQLDLENPKTFNEKLQWLKIHDRNPLYTKLVDKYAVRLYITERIGEKYLIPLYGIYDSFDEIDFSKLPNQFVIKCNHDSGGVIVCKNKAELNKKLAKQKINKSLNKNYYYSGREWPYKNVKPKIIVEKYMEDVQCHELIDYKVMCFHGEPKLIFTCSERFSGDLKVTFFDLNWKRLAFERHYSVSDKKIKKPKNLKNMIELSKILSTNIPFVRVDWYEVNGEIYFGEMTFYPGGGMEEFRPDEWDRKLGDMIDLDLVKKNEK